MFVTLFGIVTLVKPLQPENAELLMFVTPSSITTFVILFDDPNTLLKPCLRTQSEIVTLIRPLQSENADHLMFVTLFGIVTLVRSLQSENAR